MRYRMLALAAAAMVAGLVGPGGAQAANVMTGGAMPQIAQSPNTNIEMVRNWRWRRHHHHFGGSGLWLGFGVPFYQPYYEPYYYRPYYRSYYRPVGSGHVRWCLAHYRTYNPRTNTFIGFDGDRHRCRSPYRY